MVQGKSKCIEVLLCCHLAVIILAKVISGFDDHIDHCSFIQFIKFSECQPHLLCPQEKNCRVYFTLRWAASFFGLELVFLDPR
jgi:hypothetical protein